MGINLGWHPADPSVVLWTFGDAWTPDELVDATNDVGKFFEEAGGVTDVIADITNVGEFSGVIGKFPKVMQSNLFTHEYSGFVVWVGIEGYAEILGQAFLKFGGFKGKVHFADSQDQALALIHELRAGG